MCVCVCVCVCIYIYIYIYTLFTDIYISLLTNIQNYINIIIYMYACVHEKKRERMIVK